MTIYPVFPGAKGVTWPDLKTKRIPQCVLGVINKNNCWLTGKASGTFKMHDYSILFKKKKIPCIRNECVCVYVCIFCARKVSHPDEPLMRCFQSSLASYFIALSWSPCNTAMNKCNQSNWLPEIFFNAPLRTRYICRANKYKISVPVGSVWWEWVICLAYERCIHFRS